MDWPAVDAPDDVKALGKKLIAVLEDHDAAVMGPAIAVVFGYTILELADRADDMAMVDRMMEDVCAICIKYGAAIESFSH
jgi:hypothetical protein